MKFNMRLSQQATTSVRPQDFWIAVATAVLIVCGICLYPMQTRESFGFSPWFFGAALLLSWILALIDLVRYGKPAFGWQRLALLTGITLYAGGNIWHNPYPVIVWAGNLGMFYIVASSLSVFFDFGKQRDGVSGER